MKFEASLLHWPGCYKIVNVYFIARWQRNTMYLLRKSETDYVKWGDICLFVLCFMGYYSVKCLTPFRRKVLVLHSCLLRTWGWKQHVHLRLVTTYSNNRLENQKNTADTKSTSRIRWQFLYFTAKNHSSRLAPCEPVIHAALYTHMLYPFDLKQSLPPE